MRFQKHIIGLRLNNNNFTTMVDFCKEVRQIPRGLMQEPGRISRGLMQEPGRDSLREMGDVIVSNVMLQRLMEESGESQVG